MGKTVVMERNPTLDAVVIVYVILLCVLCAQLIGRSRRTQQRVLFFTLDKDGNATEVPEQRQVNDDAGTTNAE